MSAKVHVVYALRHLASSRVYVGVSSNLTNRLKQHARYPNRRMRRDVLAARADGVAFSSAFLKTELSSHAEWRAAAEQEKLYISIFDARGTNGYNMLPGAPGSDAFTMYAGPRGLLRRQPTTRT